jgi:hypothetical protein
MGVHMKKTTIGIIILIAAAAVAGFWIIKNQKTNIAETQKELVGSEVPTSPTPTDSPQKIAEAKQDTTTMVTKIEQITLSVFSPSNKSTVTTSKVLVKGKTLPKAEIYANEAEGIADANGMFSLSVTLDDGDNDIIVTAVDAEGNVAETVVTVTYNAGE